MNKKVGLWFDDSKAVIISISEDGERRDIIASDMEHYLRFSANTPGDGSPDDSRDVRYWNHLGEYYNKVIALIGDSESIQIFGPGEAKDELKKRLKNTGLANYSITTETIGKLTNSQVAKKVRAHFPSRSQYDIF